MLFTAVDHPSIACYDVQRQIDWYCRNFGMRVIATNGQTPPAVVIGYDDNVRGGAMIEMMPAIDPGPKPAEGRRLQPGIRHVALRVASYEEAYAKLRELGVPFTTEEGNAVGGGRTILFRDPEGNELQIVER